MDQVNLKSMIERLNAILSAEQVLYQINYRVESIQQSGPVIKAFCPIHQETMIRSLMVDPNKKTFRCNYFNCPGNRGGHLFDLYRLAKDVSEEEAVWFWAKQTGLDQELIAAGEQVPSSEAMQQGADGREEQRSELHQEVSPEAIQTPEEVLVEDLIETEPVEAAVEPSGDPGPGGDAAGLKDEPGYSDVYRQAVEAFESNKYNQAKVLFEKALPLAKAVEDRAECEVLLARCQIQLKNTDQAVGILEEALKRPGNPQIIKKEIHYRLAEAWERGGDKKKALELFQEVLETYGPYRDVESRLAQKRQESGKKNPSGQGPRKISFI